MAKPTDLFRWATDVGRTLLPPSWLQDLGWTADDQPPARILNYLANGAYQWHQYLDNLHGETQFLNKAYTWVGAHVHSAAVTLSAAANLNGAVTFGTGVNPALGSALEEVVYGAPRLRGKCMPLRPQSVMALGSGVLISNWVLDNDGILKSDVASSVYRFPIELPSGSTLKAMVARVKPRRTGGSNQMAIWLRKITLDVVSGTGNTISTITGTGPDNVTSGGLNVFDLIHVGTLSEAMDNAAYQYVGEIISTDGSGGGPGVHDEIHSIYCQFEETRATGGI